MTMICCNSHGVRSAFAWSVGIILVLQVPAAVLMRGDVLRTFPSRFRDELQHGDSENTSFASRVAKAKVAELPVGVESLSRTWGAPCPRQVYDVEPENRVFIHIGKCGGGTIKKMFHYRVRVHVAHAGKSISGEEFRRPKETDHLIITVREPLERLISAWYWNIYYYENENKWPVWRCWKCSVGSCVKDYYPSFNAFAEDLGKNTDAEAMWTNGCIEHIKQGFVYYIKHIRYWIKAHPCQVHVVRQEHFAKDVQDVFGVTLNRTDARPAVANQEFRRKHLARPTGEQLSDLALRNLQEKLVEEYAIYLWLLRLNNLQP
eukprot:gb/GECG01000961.1/.p1 GENE.gb/GECG01000961.1/~~gb/GECG01000961.1/.p1  ORF type:complete len:318 (+),score=18.79 gb/GECG01000961.1/:1-954(+)